MYAEHLQLQPTTKSLIKSIGLDLMPNCASQTDFGLDQGPLAERTFKFGALQWAYRHETVSAKELDEALGNGPQLTEIVHRVSPEYGPNPYTCEIETIWDYLEEEEE